MPKKSSSSSPLKGLKVEDILNEELRREMGAQEDPKTHQLKVRQTISRITDWDDIMHSVNDLPLEVEGYTKKVSELTTLREILDRLSTEDYDSVKRTESRKKQLKQFVNTMSMYYNLIFSKAGDKSGYGVLIYFPKLSKDPERSPGFVLVEKKVMVDGRPETRFERAKFDDFLLEVRPYIEILGDLYRKNRKS